ncbi:MAG TPA: WYL domain-containing protein [Mycobacteriales bacterium]|nr:WYL domain-containing protein [Mycobacteriales bacterium]
MSRKKTERQASLVMCLLNATRHLTVQEIRDTVPGYDSDTEEAFRRMFERDKDELREMGVPLETGGENNDGYRIPRRDYELQDIDLEPDEAAAVALASRLWESAPLSGAVGSALVKLRAAGVDAQAVPADVEVRIEAGEPAFAECWRATHEGRVLRFDYRRPGGTSVETREVEPWGMVSRRGWWYLVGHDRARQATRVFRLSRVVGAVAVVGPAGAVSRPEDLDLGEAVGRVELPEPTHTAQVRVRAGRGAGLRRDARSAAPGEDGWDVLDLPYADPARLAGQVAQYGADAVVLGPDDVRDALVAHLEALVEVAS